MRIESKKLLNIGCSFTGGWSMVHILYFRIPITMVLLLFSIVATAQIERWDSLMNLAKICSKEREYFKSNEYYELVILAINPYDNDELLTNKIKGTIAINYIHLGVPLFKEKKYEDAKHYFEKAIEYAVKDPKVFPVANSWMGDWYSWKALDVKIATTDLQQSVEYSLLAEEYYERANAPEKLLKEQVSRAAVLCDLSQIEKSKRLLQQVISECEGNENRTIILSKALNELGYIELKLEDFQSAILHLECSYDLSLSKDSSTAKLAAMRLQQLYEFEIPDKTKAEFWKNRSNAINDKE